MPDAITNRCEIKAGVKQQGNVGVPQSWSLPDTPSLTSTTLNFDDSAIAAPLMVPGSCLELLSRGLSRRKR
jgi:hypothetical protein